jgi:hypothetical protein
MISEGRASKQNENEAGGRTANRESKKVGNCVRWMEDRVEEREERKATGNHPVITYG